MQFLQRLKRTTLPKGRGERGGSLSSLPRFQHCQFRKNSLPSLSKGWRIQKSPRPYRYLLPISFLPGGRSLLAMKQTASATTPILGRVIFYNTKERWTPGPSQLTPGKDGTGQKIQRACLAMLHLWVTKGILLYKS